MKNFKIISDGCCDLDAATIEKYDIEVIPFCISFNETDYYKEIQEIGIREVYERMMADKKVFPKTSLPSMQDYIDAFTKYAEAGIPAICICFTPSLSGSYNGAINARDMVLEDYPDAKLTVINSEAATVSQYLLVVEAGRMLEAGVSYEDTISVLEQMKKTNRIFFTVGSLDYLIHGGRIGRVAAIAGGVLALKPLIILKNGEIDAAGVGRNRKKTLLKTISLLDKYLEEEGYPADQYNYCIGFGYDIKEGEAFYRTVKKHLSEDMGVDESAVKKCQIGATIAVHTGPEAVGIGVVRKYETYLNN